MSCFETRNRDFNGPDSVDSVDGVVTLGEVDMDPNGMIFCLY